MTRETTCGARTVAVVPGGANGLGHELAILYARSGYDLVLIDRDSRLDISAETLEQRFGVGVTGVCQDLADAGAVDRLASLLAPVAPSIRVILSRAGYRIHGPFSPDDLRVELATVSRDYVEGFRPDRPPGLVSDGGRFLGAVRGILPCEDRIVPRDGMMGAGPAACIPARRIPNLMSVRK
jgi:NAD(P)-dependent dehydrogenase (short-subunit alcohol dehydrogenase family)